MPLLHRTTGARIVDGVWRRTAERQGTRGGRVGTGTLDAPEGVGWGLACRRSRNGAPLQAVLYGGYA